MSETLNKKFTPNKNDETKLILRTGGEKIVPMRIATVENADGTVEKYAYNTDDQRADKERVYETKPVSDKSVLDDDRQAELARELSGLPLKDDRIIRRNLDTYQEGTITHYRTQPDGDGGKQKWAEFEDAAHNKSTMHVNDLAPNVQSSLRIERRLPFRPRASDETKLIRRTSGDIVPMKIAYARDPTADVKRYAYNANEKGVFERKPISDLEILSDEAQAKLERELNGEITEDQIKGVGEEVLGSVGVGEPVPDTEEASDLHDVASVAEDLIDEKPKE